MQSSDPDAPKADPADLAPKKATFEKLAAISHAAEAKIHQGAKGLLAELQQLYDGDADAAQMEKDVQAHFDKLSQTFDSSLASKLKAAGAAATGQELAKARPTCERGSASSRWRSPATRWRR